jgi:hypothetical protein
MNETENLLKKYLVSGQKAARWLERSQNFCQSLPLAHPLPDEVFDQFENLTSRFARLLDIVLQKLFRLFDKALLESSGSLIDVIHRAEKRGLCEAKQMRSIRELGNSIAHEYVEEDLVSLFVEVQGKTSEILSIFRRTESFVLDKIINKK